MMINSYNQKKHEFKLFGIIPIFSRVETTNNIVSDNQQYNITMTKQRYQEEFEINDKRPR